MCHKQDAVDILNGFIADMCVAVEVLRDYEEGDYPKRDSLFRQGIYRLCLQALILNCAKYTEFCRDYGKLLHECCPDLTKKRNQIKDDLEKRSVNDLRSKYIAHNICEKTKRPFTIEQADNLIYKIIGGTSVFDFINWVMPEDPSKVDTNEYFTGFLSILRDKVHEKL